MSKCILNNINNPKDVKKLSIKNLNILSDEIRNLLINTVSKTGGHLSSNLGVVDLTVSIHKCFNSPDDMIFFDVGHQCYTHKIITGRKDKFSTLRQLNGISGFPKPYESEHDCFVCGHSSNALSAAYGLAISNKQKNNNNYTIVIVGDGALTGGQSYEALNNIGRSDCKIIIIINNNGMSISKNVGGLSRYLSSIRSKKSYLTLKRGVSRKLVKIPLIGNGLYNGVEWGKKMLKTVMYSSTFFEELGFTFFGQVDGHNIKQLIKIFKQAKNINKPVVIQVKTIKGKGYIPAEQNPGGYHGVKSFDVDNIDKNNPDVVSLDSYSAVMGRYINKLAKKDEKIYAVTAAMKYGTGLQFFYNDHKDRFFDVGIAEAHAVTFCTGLAYGGNLPVFAVYSTFLQRGYDQVLNDCGINNTHIILAIDRAGIVGDDGETHNGIYDISFLSTIPNTTIYSPESYNELEYCLHNALYVNSGIVAVRYPKGKEQIAHELHLDKENNIAFEKNNGDTLLVSFGKIFSHCYIASQKLLQKGFKIDVLKLVKIFPIEDAILNIIKDYKKVIFIEEGIENGGIGQQLALKLIQKGFLGKYYFKGIKNPIIPQGSVEEIYKILGYDVNGIMEFILNNIQ